MCEIVSIADHMPSIAHFDELLPILSSIRTRVLSELHIYYTQKCQLDNYAGRLGELMSMMNVIMVRYYMPIMRLFTSQEIKALNREEIAVYKLLDVDVKTCDNILNILH